jgi:CHAD domain-containing protein
MNQPSSIRARIVCEIEEAIERLPDGDEQPAPARPEVETIHAVRKHFKNVRAGLRLIREALGDEVYRRENHCFRDAGRSLAVVRDAQALRQALEKLAPDSAELRDGLQADMEQAERSLRDSNAFAVVRELAAAALVRLQATNLENREGSTIERGLRHVFRSGRRALRQAKEDPTDELLHELRKRSQHLRGALELLQLEGKPLERARRLARLLGDDHDLAVLDHALNQSRSESPTRSDDRERVSRRIARRRAKLQKRALTVGRRLYRTQPKRFAHELLR